VLPPQGGQLTHYAARGDAAPAKAAIGAAAAALIRDGDRVLFDTSTTVAAVARAVAASPLHAVTNSIDIADALGARDGVALHLVGGRFHPFQRSLEGAQARLGLAHFQFDKLILGACAIDSQGLTCPSDEEACLKQAMIRQASQVIVVAEAAKFGQAFLHRACTVEDSDLLVTDQPLPAILAEKLAALGVDALVAPGAAP
jgi:DeoR/GlpR family transcriptional regulator of sugar metabolism